MLGVFLLLASGIMALAAIHQPQVVLRAVPHCRVLGTIQKNWMGESFYAFRGISYAEPPVGELHFRDPMSVVEYPAIIDARYDGHDCPSIYATNASEDCLKLNVYSSQISQERPLLPVVVFIHPGGLYIGSGLSTFLGPDYLLSKPIVLVTFNYRLGTLGFLSWGNKWLPGNAGFKDQAMVLQWVHTHIASFGGDPQQVTLMGYSAGALSASLHLVSPLSRHLFHRAIIMSGSLPPQADCQLEKQQRLAIKQAKVLGCNVTAELSEYEELLKCFEQFNGTTIAASLRQLFEFGKDNPIYLWLPVNEKNYGQKQFITSDFYTTMKSTIGDGNFSRVPLLIGYNTGEFCTSAAEILHDHSMLQQLQMHFNDLAPKIFMYDPGMSHVTAALQQRYLPSSQPWSFERLCDLFSDALLRFGAHRLARFAIAAQTPVFTYQFEQRGRFTNLPNYAAHWGKARVEHMDDLMYLFHIPPHHRIAPNDTVDAPIVRLYVEFMYEFIRNGELPSKHAIINDHITYSNSEMINFAASKFWEELFPHLQQQQQQQQQEQQPS